MKWQNFNFVIKGHDWLELMRSATHGSPDASLEEKSLLCDEAV